MSTVTETLPRRHPIAVDDFHRMGEAGIFAPQARVELIEGEILDMPPIGPQHAATVARLARAFDRIVGDEAIVWPQNPVVLGKLSEPQPDLALLRYREDFYAGSHPSPEDVLLLVEIAETTLRYDRETKIPLYARFEVGEVWLLDLQRKHLDIYRHAAEGRYTTQMRAHDLTALHVEAFPGLGFDLSGVF